MPEQKTWKMKKKGENMIGMPNPYTDHDTLKEAEEDALTGLVEQVQ